MMLSGDDRQWMLEQLQRVETKLIAEFRRCASPVDLRVRSHAAVIRTMDAEAALDKTTRPDEDH